jgi:hypothetical protein
MKPNRAISHFGISGAVLSIHKVQSFEVNMNLLFLFTLVGLALTNFMARPALAADSKPIDVKANLAAHVYMSDPEYYKMVYLWDARKNAEREAKNSGIHSELQKNEFIDARVRSAEDFVNTESFKNSLDYALTSDLAGKIGFSKTYDALSKRVDDRSGKTPYVGNAEKAQLKGEQIFKALFDRRSPDHELAKQAVKRVGYDDNISFENQKPIRAALESEFLRNEARDIKALLRNEVLSDQQRQRLEQKMITTLKSLVEKTEKMTSKVNAVTKKLIIENKVDRNRVLWNDLTDKEKGEVAKEQFDQVAQFSGTLSAFAQSNGNGDAARGFHKFAVVNETLGNLAMTSFQKSFSSCPVCYVNVYSSAAMALANMIMNTDEGSQMEAIMEALQKIATQIEDLRDDMTARFDQLDYSTRSYFEQQIFAIGKVGWSADQAFARALNIENNIWAIRRDMERGFRAATAGSETYFVTTCLHSGLSAKTIEGCRNYFGQMAQNGNSGPDGKNAVSLDDLKNLSDNLKKVNPSQDLFMSNIHPAAWILYAKNFLRVFDLNTRFRYLAKESVENYGQWSLNSMIQSGQAISRSFKNLLLNDSSLKTDVLLDLLNLYRQEAIRKIRDGARIAKNNSQRGPNPFVGFDSKALPEGAKYSFAADPIDFCRGADQKVSSPESKADLREGALYGLGMAPYQFRKVVEFVQKFDKKWFRGENIIPILSPSLLWISILGEKHNVTDSTDFGRIQVVPCWRSIAFTKFSESKNWDGRPLDVELKMELEIHLLYKAYRKNDSDILFSKYLFQSNIFNKAYPIDINPYTRGEECHPINSIWNDKKFCTDKSVTQPLWTPVAQDPKPYFTSQPVPSTPELEEFKTHLQVFEQSLQAEALENLDRAHPATASLPSLRALKLAVLLGLNSKQPQVNDFVAWLSTDAGLPDENRFAFEGMVNADPELIIQLLDQRINIAKEKIMAIREAHDLSPRTEEIDDLLRRLGEFQ